MVCGILSCRLRGSGGLVVSVGLATHCLGEVAFGVGRTTLLLWGGDHM
jgi:hypothetical protein